MIPSDCFLADHVLHIMLHSTKPNAENPKNVKNFHIFDVEVGRVQLLWNSHGDNLFSIAQVSIRLTRFMSIFRMLCAFQIVSFFWDFLYIGHYNCKICRVVLCLKTSNRSLKCRKPSHARPYSFFQRTTATSLAGSAVPRVILRFHAHLLTRIKERVSPIEAICMNVSLVRGLAHSNESNV